MRIRLMATASLAIAACTSSPDTRITGVGRPPLRAQATAGPLLGCGKVVPVGALVMERARPYDPRDGCPTGITTGAADPRARVPHQVPGHLDAGFVLQFTQGYFGYHEAPDASDLPAAPDSDLIVYAPTALPPGNACIEATTIRTRFLGHSDTQNAQGFWDHCNLHFWFYYQDFNFNNFRTKYVRTSYGESKPHVVVEVYETDTTNKCWQAYLLNYSTGYYDLVTQNFGSGSESTICGTGSNTANGWTAWESYGVVTTPSCATITDVGAHNLETYTVASGWYGLVLNPNAGAFLTNSCWTDNYYTMVLPYLFSTEWRAQTPGTWPGW